MPSRGRGDPPRAARPLRARSLRRGGRRSCPGPSAGRATAEHDGVPDLVAGPARRRARGRRRARRRRPRAPRARGGARRAVLRSSAGTPAARPGPRRPARRRGARAAAAPAAAFSGLARSVSARADPDLARRNAGAPVRCGGSRTGAAGPQPSPPCTHVVVGLEAAASIPRTRYRRLVRGTIPRSSDRAQVSASRGTRRRRPRCCAAPSSSARSSFTSPTSAVYQFRAIWSSTTPPYETMLAPCSAKRPRDVLEQARPVPRVDGDLDAEARRDAPPSHSTGVKRSGFRISAFTFGQSSRWIVMPLAERDVADDRVAGHGRAALRQPHEHVVDAVHVDAEVVAGDGRASPAAPSAGRRPPRPTSSVFSRWSTLLTIWPAWSFPEPSAR